MPITRRLNEANLGRRARALLVVCLCALCGAQASRASQGATPIHVDPSRCAFAKLTPRAGNLARVRTATLCLVNQERALHGLRALRVDRRLERAAQGHSEDMARADYFEHTSPSGRTLLSRILASGYLRGYLSYEVGENITCGTLYRSTPYAAVEGWIASPEHLANILNGGFQDTGIGVVAKVPARACGTQPGATYTQDFGVVRRPRRTAALATASAPSGRR